MDEKIKWDGSSPIDHEDLIKDALIGEKGLLNDQEKIKAVTISYGDLGKLLKNVHGDTYEVGHYGVHFISCNDKTVVVIVRKNSHSSPKVYEMTWNKAAKAINRWLKAERNKSI